MWVFGNFPNFPFLMNNGLKAIAITAIRRITIGNNMPSNVLFIFAAAKVHIFFHTQKNLTHYLT